MRFAVVIAVAIASVAGCTYTGRNVGPDAGGGGDDDVIDAVPGAPDGTEVSGGADAAPGTPDAATSATPDAEIATTPDAAAACTAEDTTSACVPGGACTDGEDNDGDGATDCRDSGCTGICGLSVCCGDGSCADLIIFCP